jgi:hypothetical protein
MTATLWNARTPLAAPFEEQSYRKVVRVPFTPPRQWGRTPASFSPEACVRCVEGGGSQWNLFDGRDISHFWAQDKYTCFSWHWPEEGAQEQLLDESLKTLETRLSAFGFVRVHRRQLVNLRFVRQVKLISGPDGARALLVMQDGTRIEASRRGTRLLKKHLLRLAPQPSPVSAERKRTRAACRVRAAR